MQNWRSMERGSSFGALRRLVFSIVLIGFFGHLQLAHAQTMSAGRVANVIGIASILRDGVARSLAVGDAVLVSDSIVTGADSRVHIEFHDNATLTVGPRTLCEISTMRETGNKGLLRGVLVLISGIVRVVFRAAEPNASFEVQTRSAVASVRSTEWIVEAKPAATAVFVVDGRVTVRGAQNMAVQLAAGEGTDVMLGAAPATPVRWGARRVAQAESLTRVP